MSKGSNARPFSVSREEYRKRFDAALPKRLLFGRERFACMTCQGKTTVRHRFTGSVHRIETRCMTCSSEFACESEPVGR